MKTLETLGQVQLSRTRALPHKFAENPLRAAALDGIQRRNALLDAMFYDVGVVTKEEIPELAFWLAREGAVLVVPPTGAGALEVFPSTETFFASGRRRVGALAVSGVGSSALGSAAFARNVADAVGEPVAAVVSGYGLSDVLTEALGGYFWFGALNRIRHLFEPLDTLTRALAPSEREVTGVSELSAEEASGLAFVRASRDTLSVVALLKRADLEIPLLIGHSKGNLVISEALYALGEEDAGRAGHVAETARIVTVSAKIPMPSRHRRVLDIIGEWDGFGQLNSAPDIRADVVVPRAWHSTNPEFPLGMGIRVTRELASALPRFDELISRPQAYSVFGASKVA